MPTYNEAHKPFYKTRDEVIKIFRNVEKQKCQCQSFTWAGNLNKATCLNCIRKKDLAEELKNKEFWTGLKHLKYWKVRRKGQYKVPYFKLSNVTIK